MVGGGNRDIIQDFVPGEDVLDLTRLDADTATPALDAFSWIGLSNFSGAPGQIRYQQVGAYVVVQADLNGDKAADLEIGRRAISSSHARRCCFPAGSTGRSIRRPPPRQPPEPARPPTGTLPSSGSGVTSAIAMRGHSALAAGAVRMGMEPTAPPPAPAPRMRARAVLLGERLDTGGLERSDLINAAPLAFRTGPNGFAVLFRYGVAVLVGLSPVEEDEFLRGLAARVSNPVDPMEEESAVVVIAPEKDEQIAPGGPIVLSDLSPARLVVLADALAKNVALARDERQVSRVFEVIDPFAAELAANGRPPGNRRSMLRLIGQALQVRQRLSGRIEVSEKPDILWDRPDLERLHARLADEYELSERAGALTRKLEVIGDTAQALTDLIDTDRSVRLEAAIVLLIVVEIVITLYDLFLRTPK